MVRGILGEAVGVGVVAFALMLSGCGQKNEAPPIAAAVPPAEDKAASPANPEVEKALSKLSPESRKLAEAQRVCPIGGDDLGTMGTPVELKTEGETVFLCCGHCKKAALKDPAGTVAKVKKLREQK